MFTSQCAPPPQINMSGATQMTSHAPAPPAHYSTLPPSSDPAATPTPATSERDLISILRQLEDRMRQAEHLLHQQPQTSCNHPSTSGEILAAKILKPPTYYGYDDPKQPSEFIC